MQLHLMIYKSKMEVMENTGTCPLLRLDVALNAVPAATLQSISLIRTLPVTDVYASVGGVHRFGIGLGRVGNHGTVGRDPRGPIRRRRFAGIEGTILVTSQGGRTEHCVTERFHG